MSTIVTERGRIGESERKTERLDEGPRGRAPTTAARPSTPRPGAQEARHAQEDAGRGRGEADDARRRGCANSPASSKRSKQVEDAEAEVKRLEAELKPLPADPEAAVRELQQRAGAARRLAQHVAAARAAPPGPLGTDQGRRAAEKAAQAEEATLKAEGIEAKEEFAALEAKAKAARDDRAAKDQAAAEARALARQARELADEFKHAHRARRRAGRAGSRSRRSTSPTRRRTATLDAKAAEQKLKTLTDAAAEGPQARRRTDREGSRRPRPPRQAPRPVQGRRRRGEAGRAATSSGSPTRAADATSRCRTSSRQKIGPREPDDWSKVDLPRPPRHHRARRRRRTGSTA